MQSLCQADGPYRNCKRLERKKKGKGMVTRGLTFRHAEPKLTESKIQRREQRLKAARPFVEEQKKRHHQVIMSQLALVQALASGRAQMPVPDQLLASLGRLSLSERPVAAMATG